MIGLPGIRWKRKMNRLAVTLMIIAPLALEAMPAAHSEAQELYDDCSIAERWFKKADLATDTDARIHYLKRGLSLCPNNARARYRLALLFVKQKRTVEAKDQLHQALQLDPTLVEAERMLKEISEKGGRDDY